MRLSLPLASRAVGLRLAPAVLDTLLAIVEALLRHARTAAPAAAPDGDGADAAADGGDGDGDDGVATTARSGTCSTFATRSCALARRTAPPPTPSIARLNRARRSSTSSAMAVTIRIAARARPSGRASVVSATHAPT